MTSGQITYDLRRLRLHGLIARLPHTHRYHVTDAGLRTALFLARAHNRLLCTGLAEFCCGRRRQPRPEEGADAGSDAEDRSAGQDAAADQGLSA